MILFIILTKLMGSGRLKHFCQLCRKQCKDQNGFKCHLNSASHQLRVRDFATNPLQHIQKASRQFQGRFIQLVKTKYAGQPKYLQQLYNELIEEKKFLKFNHTQWKNLAEFGNYLRQVRNIQVIGTPPNCKILYLVNKTKDFIDAAKKEKLQNEREKQKQQFQKSMEARIQREKHIAAQKQEEFNNRLATLQQQQKHMQISDKLQFNISGFNQDNKRSAFYSVSQLQKQYQQQIPFYQKKVDQIEKLYNQLKQKNKDNQESDIQVQWIKPGITVRIKPHQIDPAFHNKKCKIIRIVQAFVAEIAVGTASIEIDQTNLETVIPKVGCKVMILKDKHAGEVGIMSEANIDEGYGIVQVKLQKLKISFNFISRFDE